ncbi:hypothetical protein [Actinobaculum massiliense]|nr:hypothetical protein [Actinobaculum massiliense]
MIPKIFAEGLIRMDYPERANALEWAEFGITFQIAMLALSVILVITFASAFFIPHWTTQANRDIQANRDD